jgi:hypothetical protein
MLVTPPSQNLEETDWQPDGRKQSEDDDSIDLEAMRKRLERLL